jgi:hypothetical protein
MVTYEKLGTEFRVWRRKKDQCLPAFKAENKFEKIIKTCILHRDNYPFIIVLYAERLRVYELGESLRLILIYNLETPLVETDDINIYIREWQVSAYPVIVLVSGESVWDLKLKASAVAIK